MRKIFGLGLFTLIACLTVGRAHAETPNLCSSDEVAYFSCVIKGSGKIASLCGSHQIGPDGSYLQYRFGKAPTPEMQFPADKKNSVRQFRYEHYFRAQVDRTSIFFSNNGYEYEVFSDQEGDVKPPTLERGVRVTAPGANGKESTLLCGPQFSGQKWDVLESGLPAQN